MKKEYLRDVSICLFTVCLFVLLVSCGSGGGGGSSGASTGTASITLSVSQDSIPADGVSSTAITATLKNSSGGAAIKGTAVTFSTTLGTFPGGVTSYATTTPDDSGVVEVSLIAGTTAGSAVVTVRSNSVTQTISIELTESGGGTPGASASIEI